MDVLNWLKKDTTIVRSKKSYAHFDYRTDISKCRNYISNPRNIISHGFYPFIHYEIKMVKYSKTKEKKEKIRDICYAAHIDRCIYQLYSHILNEQYNKRVCELGISSTAVAYRTDLQKNNIDFARQAFHFIRSSPSCYVMIGDFTSFFDNLDHKYLKKQWCNLIDQPTLPADHYAVFKNITKYSKWELTDLLSINNLPDTHSGRHALNNQARVLTAEQYQDNRSHITKNPNSFGIPQGSPISALLANVYMLAIDKQIHDIVEQHNGMYMRYSDDFIIVLPDIEKSLAVETLSGIVELLNSTEGLTLQHEKTQFFSYSDSTVINCGTDFHADADCRKRFINFLGFTFDGNQVSIRAKTISKYYSRMHRKAKTIKLNAGYSPKGKKISKKELYKNILSAAHMRRKETF